VGKKPLFYTEVDGQWVFASELQALLQHPGLAREVDWAALDDYLTYGYVPAPKTIFLGVYKLSPAHWLTLKLRPGQSGGPEVHVERYWQLAYEPKRRLSEEDAVDGLLEVLGEAVRLRMIADVPLGALLSGGIDSSIVVALMSQLSDRPVKTFSIGFDDQEFNELPHARRVAERCGTEHHELIVRARWRCCRLSCDITESRTPTRRRSQATTWPSSRGSTSRWPSTVMGVTSASRDTSATRGGWRLTVMDASRPSFEGLRSSRSAGSSRRAVRAEAG
jgi:hypothetical protein